MTSGLIIKPVADVDEYVVWSNIVEAPLFVGDRAAVLRHLGPGGGEGDSTGERLERADRDGTSSRIGDGCFGDYMIFEQRGYIDCPKLGELARLLVAGRRDEALDLCRPFEDEAEVRRG